MYSTGDGVDEVDGVGDAREVRERPVEGVLGVGPEGDGDEQVPAAAALPGLALELRRRVRHHRDEPGQHHLPPAVLLHVLLHRLHRRPLAQSKSAVQQFSFSASAGLSILCAGLVER